MSIRTVILKLDIPVESVLPTVQAYTKAYNYSCQVGYNNKVFNSIELHKLVYSDIKEYLPSQLAISARMKAAGNLTGIKSKIKEAIRFNAKLNQPVKLTKSGKPRKYKPKKPKKIPKCHS